MYKNFKVITDEELEKLFEILFKETFEDINAAQQIRCSINNKSISNKGVNHTVKLTLNIAYKDTEFEDLSFEASILKANKS